MKNEEKIYQLNTYNIAEYTSTDYTDNDIAILGDFKNLLFNKYFKLNANIYVVCVKGRLQIHQYPKICYLPRWDADLYAQYDSEQLHNQFRLQGRHVLSVDPDYTEVPS